ncbi:hypothetical protein [Cypionkella sp.]|uniref:hypothetical protein n=1 Tax=Cypionkella sp. TaxID=2811411 RepID=UPI002ABCDDBA|nr:hypothetical protein [Cypionkella sp.]MDZ4391986.1 hypothetical protein [Cypionkella sp.]
MPTDHKIAQPDPSNKKEHDTSTNYRSFSQTYAQEGIKALMLINGGAATALLTQATDLRDQDLQTAVLWPMISWTIGLALAVVIWLVGFASTRYVDRSVQEGFDEIIEIRRSDNWMRCGMFLFILSLGLFVAGSIAFACKFAT